MRWGARPSSTHASSADRASKVSGPGPPRQWPMPGAMNSRKNSCVSASAASASAPSPTVLTTSS